MGVSAFGINAYTANAGEQVIEPHNELGAGSGQHEELYVVVTGEAEFELDGERRPRPPGRCCSCSPSSTAARRRVADDTTVLVIGGKPGAAGPPSPFEYWYLAGPEAEAGNPARAYEIAAEGLEHYPENPSLHYNLACYAALAGEADKALEHLQDRVREAAGVPRVGGDRLRPRTRSRLTFLGRSSRTSCRP